jgi:hypothetical protein
VVEVEREIGLRLVRPAVSRGSTGNRAPVQADEINPKDSLTLI